MSKLIQSLKGYEAVKKLIESEIGEYSYFEMGELQWNDSYSFEETDEEEHYKIEIKANDEHLKTLYFNYDKRTEEIEVELNEDNWEKIQTCNWTIKYLWMALLKW